MLFLNIKISKHFLYFITKILMLIKNVAILTTFTVFISKFSKHNYLTFLIIKVHSVIRIKFLVFTVKFKIFIL